MAENTKKILLKIWGKLKREEVAAPASTSKYALLSPVLIEEQEIAHYLDEFNLVLSCRDAKNIAPSGPHGAGKSSVAMTIEAEELAKGKTWLHVSLADFKGVSTERSIEDEILSQLVYKVPPESLSKSMLKPLDDGPRRKDLLFTSFLVLFGLDTAFLAYETTRGATLSLLYVSPEATFVIAAAAWCLSVGYVIYREIRAKSISRTLKRLKILNAEFELFDGANDTALDKYMDEIVYVLKKSKLDVVVFEDIDRFDNLTVFEKLRRINDLANEGRASTLRFLYLIKDSLFVEPHDRTKFFDFIIPVIPFIDPSNSINLLKRGLEAGGLVVEDTFLYQLSSFIDDPRILKEICNESIHYRDSLFPGSEMSKHCPESLIGIVAYKVLFPRDYENLQKRRGYVQSLFDKKEKLISELVSRAHEEIDKCHEELRRIKENLNVNESELNLLYLLTLTDFRQSSMFRYAYDNGPIEPADLFETLQQNKSFDIEQGLEQIQDRDTRYADRLREIRGSSDAASATWHRRIQILEKQSSEYSRMKLSDLIEASADREGFFAVTPEDLARKDDYSELGIGDVPKNQYFPLVRFLVSQGWLDETHPRYMSRIYPDSIPPTDIDFVNSVLGAGLPQPEYEISNPKAVIIRLDDKTISRSSARNYSLLAELLATADTQLAQAMLGGASHDGDIHFVAGFLSSGHFSQSVFPLLDEAYPSWTTDIIKDDTISNGQKAVSLRCAFVAKTLPSTIAKNAQEVGAFVSSLSDFPSTPIPDPQQFAESLAAVAYNPSHLDVATCDKYVLEKIIELGMYAPEANLMSKLAGWKKGLDGSIPLPELNKVLYERENELLRERALRDVNDYIGSLVSSSREPLNDEGEVVLMVLDSDSLSASTCKKYVSCLKNPIYSLSAITSNDFARIAIEQNKIKATMENLIDGYGRLGFDATLENFIYKSEKIETSDPITKETERLAQGLLEHCLNSNILDISAIERIAKSFGRPLSALSLPAEKPQAIERIINIHALKVTKNNLIAVRSAYPNLAPQLAMCDLEAYADLVCGTESEQAQCALVSTEAVEIVASPHSDLVQKLRIVEALNETIPLRTGYPEDVIIRLIELDLYDSFESLPPLYEHGSDQLKESIAKEIESRPDDFAEILLSDDLEARLLQSPKIETRAKQLDFAARRIRALCKKGERTRVRSILEKAGLADYVRLINGPMSMVRATTADDHLLEVLKALGMCGAISAETNESGLRKAYSLGHRLKHAKKASKR